MRLDQLPFATHHSTLEEVMAGYDTFTAAAETDALKVVLEAAPTSLEGPKPEALATVA